MVISIRAVRLRACREIPTEVQLPGLDVLTGDVG